MITKFQQVLYRKLKDINDQESEFLFGNGKLVSGLLVTADQLADYSGLSTYV